MVRALAPNPAYLQISEPGYLPDHLLPVIFRAQCQIPALVFDQQSQLHKQVRRSPRNSWLSRDVVFFVPQHPRL